MTKLKGNHLIQFGGQYQHNFNYHQRSDNGNAINFTTTYQIGDSSGGGLINFTGLNAMARQRDQQLQQRASPGRLLRYGDRHAGREHLLEVRKRSVAERTADLNRRNTSIPYYNMYATDTWHLKPSLTLNYGLSYAIEMPPHERNGDQVMWVDTNGTHPDAKLYGTAEPAACRDRSTIRRSDLLWSATSIGGRKYPYNPYFGALSPRVSTAWNPHFEHGSLQHLRP